MGSNNEIFLFIDRLFQGVWINSVFLSRDVAIEEVDHLFASSDDDHDDRLSYDEIINNYEIFVGSEATDYGDHLQNIDNFKDEL